MGKAGNDTDELAALEKARVSHAIRTAVIAAVLDNPSGVHTLLELPPGELGRRFKRHLCDVGGIVTVYNYDLTALRKEGQELRERFHHISRSRDDASAHLTEEEREYPERYALVRQNKMLLAEEFCMATDITKKQLEKDVAAGRAFGVVFGSETYYPAFFIPNLFDRKSFAKVYRRLEGLPDWSKWDFFTRPIESQEGSTPLQLLMVDSMKQVLKAADDFAKR